MTEVSSREAFYLIILRWIILGLTLGYLVAGSFNLVTLPALVTTYFIFATGLITAALFLNLIWFILLFSLGDLAISRSGYILTYLGIIADTAVCGLVFLSLGQTYPELWWLLLWPVIAAASFSRLGTGVFASLVILPVVYLKLTNPSLIITSDLNLLVFSFFSLALIFKGPISVTKVIGVAPSAKSLWVKNKESRASGAVADSFKIKYEEANRRLYAKDLEVKLIKQELATLESAKSKFISVTAHQMRTPLSAIKWTFNMLKSGSLGPQTPDQIEFISKGEEATEKMITIVNNLVTVDSIVTVADRATFAPVSLTKVVNDVVAEFSNQVQSRHLTLEIKKPEGELPDVSGDYAKLKMVLENLLDNAIKYSKENTAVTIKLSDEKLNTANSSIILSVTDQGIGIPKKEQSNIFTKFFRAANAVSEEPNGSGVGLFIAKDIVQEHSGSLWFESVDGKGTTFFVSLPIKGK